MVTNDQASPPGRSALLPRLLHILLLGSLFSILFGHTSASADASFSVGSRPARVVISPDDSEVYVSNGGSNSITMIHTTRWSTLRGIFQNNSILVGKNPGPMSMSAEGTLLFVGNRGGFEFRDGRSQMIESSVSIIDLKTKSTVASIPVGGEIIDLAGTPDGKKLYLAVGGNGGEGLKKIDIGDGYRVSWISRVRCPKAVVFSSDGKRAYVNYQCAPTPGTDTHDPIMVYDALSDSEVPLFIIYGWADGRPIANVGGALAISPDGTQVWAAGNDACARTKERDPKGGCPPVDPNEEKLPYTARGIINIIETDRNTLAGWLPFIGYDARDPTKPVGAYFPTFSPDGEEVAVTTGSSILFFSVRTHAEVRSFPVVARDTNLAFTHDKPRRAYVAVRDENHVQELQIDPEPSLPWWSYVIAAVGVLLGTGPLLSPAIARLMRLAVGQRLRLVSEASDYEIVVRDNPLTTELSIRDRRKSDYFATELDPTAGAYAVGKAALREQWDAFSAVRAKFSPETTIRVEVATTKLFRRPWAGFLTSDLGEAISPAVAGQVVNLIPAAEPATKVTRLVFASLGAQTPHSGQTVIPGLAAHLQRLSQLLKHRLVTIGSENADATVGDLVHALRTADIVHVMAHASPAGIVLKDRAAERSDLEGAFRIRAPRCRLLVLAACSINRLGDASFVECLVQTGISVLGATQEMDAIVAETFFDAFYTDFVPRRGRAGSNLAVAMRAGGRACRDQFRDNEIARDNLRALVFYGDPTLHLVFDWRAAR